MIANWVLTYAVYSTALLGLAWICSRLVPDHWHGVKEAVWKSAIVMALVSATLGNLGVLDSLGQLGTTGSACGPEPEIRPAAVTTIGPLASTPLVRVADAQAKALLPTETRADESERTAGECGTAACGSDTYSCVAEAGPICVDASTASILSGGSLRGTTIPVAAWASALLTALLVLGGTFGAYRAGLSWVRIRRHLGRRLEIENGPAANELRELCRLAGLRHPIRLTDTGTGSTPLALGLREICIPEQSFLGLPESERRSALAHELAHLVRRDPLWFTALHVLESVFFFLPLHRVARREVQQSAEFLCDDWATVLTGSRLDLARCLAKVAEWRYDPAPAPAASMAGVSPLFARVKRLVEPERSTPRGGRPGLVAAVTLVALTGVLFGPRFTTLGTATAAVEGEPYGEDPDRLVEYVVRSARPAAPVAPLSPAHRVIELPPSAAPLVLAAPVGEPPFVLDLAPLGAEGPIVLEGLEGLEDLDLALGLTDGSVVVDLSDALSTLDLAFVDPDAGEVLFVPEDDLEDLRNGRMTVRVEGDDHDVMARIEDGKLVEVEMDAEEIPLDRCEYDGEVLTIWDEDHENEIYSTRVPMDRLREIGPELIELRTSRLPALRRELPELQERLRRLQREKGTSALESKERLEAMRTAREAYQDAY
ncbi:MAG: M56 family metallopeptidase, partial [Candidatus Eisenbacteria bacterium]